ncbi:mucin-like protein 1 [Coprinopsis cinerea AmutBmut pab1-1]|nr:mucin-like protein 1 [Coprinopsis cinerea AmutBmut pab1-1]
MILKIVDLVSQTSPGNSTLEDSVNLAARHLLQIVDAVRSNHPSAGNAVADFTSMMKEIESIRSSNPSRTQWETAVATHLRSKVEQIKRSHPGVFVDSSVKYELSKTWTLVLGSASTTVSVLKDVAEIVPVEMVKGIVGTAYSLLNAVERTRANAEEMRQIARIVSNFVVSVTLLCMDQTFKPSAHFERCFNDLEGKLTKIGRECQDMSQKSLLSRFFHQGVHKDDIESLKTELQEAINKFQTESQVMLHFDLGAFSQKIHEKLDQDAINSLPELERHGNRIDEYLDASRDDELKAILEWVDNPDHPVSWIHGAAGLGKSTLMHKVVDILRQQGRLATFAFFVKKKNKDVFTTIKMMARELATTHPRAVPAIAHAVRTCNSAHGTTLDYLQAYIVEPVRSLDVPYPIVVSMDALDEWDHHETFLRELKNISSTSPFLKFLFTSRWLHSVERGLQNNRVKELPLPPVTEETARRYFVSRFSEVRGDTQILLLNSIPQLAKLANGLLVWAATVCNLILSDSYTRPPVHALLERILQSGTMADQDERLSSLYHEALRTILGDKPEQVKVGAQILSHMLVLQESIATSAFTELVDLPQYPHAVPEIHKRLRTLQIRGTFDPNVIEPVPTRFHASFFEFLTSKTHTPFELDAAVSLTLSPIDAHVQSAKKCLSTMVSISPADYPPSVPLSPILLYSTKYWTFHLAHGTDRFQPLPPELEILLDRMSIDTALWWANRFIGATCLLNPEELAEWERDLVGLERAQILIEVGELAAEQHLIGEPHWWTWAASPWEAAVRFKESRANLELLQRLTYMYIPIEPSPEKCASSAVSILEHCVEVSKSRNGALLVRLAAAYHNSHIGSGRIEDVDRAISVGRAALALLPHPNPSGPDHGDVLHDLAVYSNSRYDKQGTLADLDNAISLGREALSLRPHPHRNRAHTLHNIAIYLVKRFEKQGNIADLDDAISLGRESLSLQYRARPDRDGLLDVTTTTLHNLSLHLVRRFMQQGEIADLDEAIALGRRGLAILPPLHPHRAVALVEVSGYLWGKFLKQGGMDVLEDAIALGREALDLQPHPHPVRARILFNLAGYLCQRITETGDIADLDDSISFAREALSLQPHLHPNRENTIYGLVVSLLYRCKTTDPLPHLDEVITLCNEALASLQPSHPLHFAFSNWLVEAQAVKDGSRTVDSIGAADLKSLTLQIDIVPGQNTPQRTLNTFFQLPAI